ncbi:LytTR family DNA-binding domain-containing protein [uncultured Chryseobacterium sp.]|uniref:LytR/AlgR family response regulator transcription factor n=1 Tax=uncultured Chryseobacterium sp. TaxID=259322 RepID=UPI0025CBD19D|nr:LytTR family DNA-binding domain-containing protein [uncultured Chryseobacterium sp.]
MKNTLHACIIDDKDDGESISFLLKKEFPEFEIDLHTKNVDFASDYLSRNSPDLLFVDIQLNNEQALETLSKLHTFSSPLIFITDSENTAISAIKKGITNCLLKPVTNLNCVLPVNKAMENFKKNRTFPFPKSRSKINLPTLQGFKRVNIDEIIRCEADSNYTSIYLLDKTKVMVSKTLHDFEKNLSGYNFFRIHHKHLINLEHLKEYIKGKGGQVVMTDNSVLDVSIRRKNEFLHKIF